MQEKELPIDTEKHVCYSKAVKKVIQDRLRQQFDEEEAKIRWEKIQQQYVEYLKTLPYLGGRKNGHNGAGGTYDCIALFAYYEVLEKKPSIEEIYEMNNAVLLPSKLLHAGLIRNTTCSNGTVCDYWIVGDESRFLREYPKRTDARGYLYNGEREHQNGKQ